jgi:hypothetical protein
MLWMPYLVYGASSVVWLLALLVSQQVRGWLFLMGVVPALAMNFVYLLFLFPLHLFPVVFFSFAIAITFETLHPEEKTPSLPRQ